MGKILIITEKPSAAKAVADAVGAGQKKKGYFEGGGYLVSWCIGHLVVPAPPEQYGDEWRKWSLESLPLMPKQWKYEVKKETKEQYEVLKKLFSGVSQILNGCDAGREGELIFRLVYEKTGCKKPVRRLWLSSMEEDAIRKGIADAQPSAGYDSLYDSAFCRQRADWLVGINGTRLFTTLYGGRILKVGRVQTPVLAMIADREKEIAGFERMPYYTVHISCGGMDAASGRMEKADAETLAAACREDGKASVDSLQNEDKALAPPKLYDLTALQRDADRQFGFTAKQTLAYLQSLYEKKLATYPRTDSRYLTDDMGEAAAQAAETARLVFADIFGGIGNGTDMDVSVLLDSGKVSDHHALILTQEAAGADLSALPENERKILALISCRLLCASGKRHRSHISRVGLVCSGQPFTASGRAVVQNGWKDYEDAFRQFYKAGRGRGGTGDSGTGKTAVPALSQGQELDILRVEVKEHFTQPPERFTDGSLLSAMERAGTDGMADNVERRGLGTPATRADIIEKLVKDGFVKREKKNLIPTKEGMELAAVLPDAVKSPQLTAEWENALALVAAGEMDADVFMDGISDMVSSLVRDCKSAGASSGAKKLFADDRMALGICPKCGGQVLKGKYGAYCVEKCGMRLSKYYSTQFTDSQVKSLLDGKKILLKGLEGRDGKPYDLCLEPAGIEECSYEKDGQTVAGYRFAFKKSYPGKK